MRDLIQPIDGKWRVVQQDQGNGYEPMVLLRYGQPVQWQPQNVIWDMALRIRDLEKKLYALGVSTP